MMYKVGFVNIYLYICKKGKLSLRIGRNVWYSIMERLHELKTGPVFRTETKQFTTYEPKMGAEKGSFLSPFRFYMGLKRACFQLKFTYWAIYILKSRLRPSAVNVCNRGKGERNVNDIFSLHFFVSCCPRFF